MRAQTDNCDVHKLVGDCVGFPEDTPINLLIFIALGWPLAQPSTCCFCCVGGDSTVFCTASARSISDLRCLFGYSRDQWRECHYHFLSATLWWFARSSCFSIRPKRRLDQHCHHRDSLNYRMDDVWMARFNLGLFYHPARTARRSRGVGIQ